ncbi:hypothetical protein COOONC_11686 [Cooperia oncophora]
MHDIERWVAFERHHAPANKRRTGAEGRCFKQSLKSLAREQLDMEIQSVGGHDSAEDAWAAMRLVLRAARSPHL